MTISSLFKARPLAVAVSMASVATFANVAYAQEETTAETVESSEVVEQQQQTEEVVVTGSRLRRDSFSSISPLTVIDADVERSLGNFDAASVLQSSTAASGQQIDTTFSGFVLDNGPGASTLSLRGLGADRSLVLLNGRRLAPAGVEGAPSSPDLNLLPSGMVKTYEILLDGASAVYGSDAIAGVANVITRKDFDGFEIIANASMPSQSGGEASNLNLTWGTSSDRGFFGMGLEYFKQESVSFDDRSWTAQCNKNYEEGLDGKFYSEDVYYALTRGMEVDGCKPQSLAGRAFVSGSRAGSVYYTPGMTNGGWPGFSESEQFGIGIDSDGDGVADVSYKDYSLNGKTGFAHLYPEVERISFLANGEYTFDGESNTTVFGEFLYSQRENYTDSGAYQLFPDVPANNPFNFCNPNGVNGIDCGLAFDQLMDNMNMNPGWVSQFDATYGPGAWNFYHTNGFLKDGALGAVETTPIVNVRGDRTTGDTKVAQARFVGGVRGDLPFMNFGSFSDWSYEASISSSMSEGKSSRYGIRGDRLDLSLATTIEDPNNPGSFICGVDNDGDGVPDGTDGCVPVNMYDPALYAGVIGDFGTAAERNYLFDSRDFDTKYYQHVFNAFMAGTLYELPAGELAGAIGVEYRHDEIESIPDDVARNGLFFGFFSDGGATGSKGTSEVFAEVSIPVLANVPLVTELTVDLSTRYTKDEFYGGAWTGGAKVGYRPVDSLLLRATYGTSYRAPNLRENFLADQSGFGSVFDPCGIPDNALDLTGNYDPTMDQRAPEVLANCAANGIDPTDVNQAGFGGFNSYSVEVYSGGTQDIEEETSESLTVGFSFDQPFWNEFDMSLGFSYYDIKVENSIIEPSASYITNSCFYALPSSPSSFCGSISRGADYRIDRIDAYFTNRDQERARGMDYTFDYRHDITVADLPFSLYAGITATRVLESSETYSDDSGNSLYYDSVGRFGYAEWTGNGRFQLSYEDWSFTWGINFIGAVSQDPTGVDPYSDVFDTNGTGVFSDSCVGIANGGTDCRDVGYADEYMLHSAGLSYNVESWGVSLTASNVFDEAPPRIDTAQVFGRNNTPLGAGYDLMGRVISLEVGVKF